MQLFTHPDYGLVRVSFAMLDIDGTTLDDGIEIKSEDDEFKIIEIVGWRDVQEMTEEEVIKLIDENLDH